MIPHDVERGKDWIRCPSISSMLFTRAQREGAWRLPRGLLFGVLVGVSFAVTFALVTWSNHRRSPLAPEAPPGMVWIPGVEFTVGTDSELGWPDEKPAHRVRVDGFWMDVTEVTNAQSRAFVEAMGYVTTAEKPPDVEEILRQSPPGSPPPTKELVVPGSLVFQPTAGPVKDLRGLLAMVALDSRGQLAVSGRTGQQHRWHGRLSRRSRHLGRCRR